MKHKTTKAHLPKMYIDKEWVAKEYLRRCKAGVERGKRRTQLRHWNAKELQREPAPPALNLDEVGRERHCRSLLCQAILRIVRLKMVTLCDWVKVLCLRSLLSCLKVAGILPFVHSPVMHHSCIIYSTACLSYLRKVSMGYLKRSISPIVHSSCIILQFLNIKQS